MRKIPISGGPHTGKTTLLNALHTEYTEAYFVEEPAERVIAAELKEEESRQDYKGIFPWNNYPAFARMVIDESVAIENSIPANNNLVFLDRSLIDNIGYGRLNGYLDLIPELKQRIRVARYAFALFCEPVGSYTATLIRRESPEQAQRTHQYLATAYEESCIPVVHLPAVSIEERLKIVAEVLKR